MRSRVYPGIVNGFSDGGCCVCLARHVDPGASHRSWHLWWDHRARHRCCRIRYLGAHPVSQGVYVRGRWPAGAHSIVQAFRQQRMAENNPFGYGGVTKG